MNKLFLCALAICVISLNVVAGAVEIPAVAATTAANVTFSYQLTESASVLPGQGAPMPTCFPGKNCGDDGQQRVIAGQGAPMPTCFPGKNCGDDGQQRVIAGQGAPMPTCFPGKNCGDDSQQQVIAGQGAPMPTCFPGKNC